jgi:threonine/homoserine/homoserine lactone efflux protein
MDQAAQLWLFFVIVLGVALLPGLDMACVLGCGLAGGRRSGLGAVAGIVAGGACLVTVTTLGIGVLVKTLPLAFNALLLAGALYIAWIGFSIFRSRAGFGAAADASGHAHWLAFRRGLFTSVLNP